MTEPDYLSIIKERGSGALDKKMGIQITEASLTRLVGTMPIDTAVATPVTTPVAVALW